MNYRGMKLLVERDVGEMEGTKIKRMKEHKWHVYNWDTRKDSTIVEEFEEKRGKQVPYYKVYRWGEQLTDKIKTFNEALEFSIDFAEEKIV